MSYLSLIFAAVPAPSKHPETYKDEEKTVKLLRIEQTRKNNCKTAQTVQHVSNSTSFKHKTPERCPKRNDSKTICPSGEQPSFSKEVSESPLSKHRDMKVMSTVHERAERFDQKSERMSCGSQQLSNCSNRRQVNSLKVKSHESLDPLSFFMMLRSSRKSPVQTPRQSTPASAGTVSYIHDFCFHIKLFEAAIHNFSRLKSNNIIHSLT